ncbi:MAG: hypothetical protein WC529_01920 [Candidatus Margulisiibacteriota bacterium]
MKFKLKKAHLILAVVAALVVVVFGVFMLIAVPEVTTEEGLPPATDNR